VLHSSEYKDKSLFAGKRVLIVGCGETGMDLAYRAVQVRVRARATARVRARARARAKPKPEPNPNPPRHQPLEAGEAHVQVELLRALELRLR